MTYREAILIPLELFKQLQFPAKSPTSKAENILSSSDVPDDVKLKILQREELLKVKNEDEGSKDKHVHNNEENNHMLNDTDIILQSLPAEVRPNANELIRIILKFPHKIRWNKGYQLVVDVKL